MTLSEFKAWFDGFSEGVGDAPTPEQWAKIKAKIADLRDKPAVTYREADQFRRAWLEASPQIGPGLPADAWAPGRVVPQNLALGATAKTTRRVRDAVSGADLGPAD